MKLLIFSDSHQSTKHMGNVLSKIGKDMDGVLHLGDGINDLAGFKKQYDHLFFHAVEGNCDAFISESGEPFKMLTLQGKRILMTHGHRYGVRREYSRLSYFASEQQADICLFGHTHVPVIVNCDGVFLMNPGSISHPRSSGYPSYGVIEITEEGRIYSSIVEIKLGEYRVLEF